MHYVTYINTAAEVIYIRVNNKKDNIGLTNFTGDYPTRYDTEIVKNYLTIRVI